MRAATAGHRAARARMAALADVDGVSTRRGAGWLAVRSGGDANDLNGVVACTGLRPDAALLADLDGWFGHRPAQWLAEAADVALTGALTDAGWQPERTGHWTGRPLPAGLETSEVRRVATAADLDAWLDVAGACGWWEGDAERARRRRLAEQLPWPRYLAVAGRTPVGMATAWREGELVELVDVAVVGTARRRGHGRALVAAVLADAPHAAYAVAAPSPDGARLLAALGFRAAPVDPDVCFYRSGR